MTAISSSTTTITVSTADLQNAKKQCQSAQTGTFDALLSMFSSDQIASSSNSSSATTGQGNGSISGIFDLLLSENSASSSSDSSGFGFSSSFDNAFGTSGPLFDYINTITSKLHLSASQNQALQNISIEHKDNAGTASVTQEIASELSAAGIG